MIAENIHSLDRNAAQTVLAELQADKGIATLAQLLSAICGLLKRQTGFEAVGIRLRRDHDYPYVETRGFSEEFVAAENQLCIPDDSGDVQCDYQGDPVLECMCGNVLRGRFNPSKPFFTKGGSFWSNCTSELLASTTEADRQARTRNRCNGEGYESVGLFPLRFGGQIIGLIQLNDRRKGRFSPESVAALEQLADGLAAGIGFLTAQDALRVSESHFRLLYEEAPLGYQSLDADGRFLEVNQAWLSTLGYAREEVLGRWFGDFLAPSQRSLFQERFPRFKEIGEVHGAEFEMVRKDGAMLVVSFDGRIARDEHGRFRQTHCVMHDVTERRRTESVLRRSRQELALRNSIARAFLTYDGEETYREILRIVLMAADSPHGLFGYLDEAGRLVVPAAAPEAELSEGPMREANGYWVFPRAMWNETWRAALDEGHMAWSDSPAPVPPGHVPILRSVCVPLVYQDAAIGLLTVGNKGTDYTAADRADLQAIADFVAPVLHARMGRERLEAQRRQTEEALRRSEGRRLEAEKLAATARLTARVAHEINNPLAGLKNCFELIRQAVPAEHPHRKFADMADREINRIARIVRQAYQLYRPRQERVCEIRVQEVVDDVVMLLEPACREHGVRVETVVAARDRVVLPEGSLRQVLYNLLGNAVEASKPGGAVTVRVACVDDELRLEVADRGCGIAPEVRAHIMEPFFTTKDGEPGGPGLGLGLPIVKGMVDALHGSLDFESRPGEGTTFRVVLPRCGAAQPAERGTAGGSRRL